MINLSTAYRLHKNSISRLDPEVADNYVHYCTYRSITISNYDVHHVERSINEIKLEAFGFNDIQLNYDKELKPTNFVCPLSSEIFWVPVIDRNQPQYSFELSWIYKWLSIRQENPYTKTELTINQLDFNNELKIKIEIWTDLTCTRLKERLMNTLITNSFFSKRAEKSCLIENRHDNAIAQHEYDKQFGLALM